MNQDPEAKKTWYSPVADIYQQARPSYPPELIDRAITLARLSDRTKVLELGCGSGNATVAFANLGIPLTCLDINADFCRVAQRNCQAYPQVKIICESFESYEFGDNKFQAVLSANAFHWMPAATKYSRAASVLNDDGYLILLWNLTPEPEPEIFEALAEIYRIYAPALFKYEGAETQAEILAGFRQEVIDSRNFADLVVEQISCQVYYTIDEYLSLISTLRRLKPTTKELLFPRLKDKLQKLGREKLKLSFLSAVFVSKKIS